MSRRAVPTVLLLPLLAVAVVVSSSACGTLANFNNGVSFGIPERERPAVPYGGVMLDLEAAARSKADLSAKVLIFPLWLTDLGLSAAFDTLTLPAAVWIDVKRAYERATGEPRPYPDIKPKWLRPQAADPEPAPPETSAPPLAAIVPQSPEPQPGLLDPYPAERLLSPQFTAGGGQSSR